MINSPNKGVQGTLHKVSGPLTPDVGHNQMNFRQEIAIRMIDWLLKNSVLCEHLGIRLCDINHNPNDDSAFIARSIQALDLIKEIDPRRFCRVHRTIRYIVNTECHFHGVYSLGKMCVIDFGRYRFDRNEKWALFNYAGLIIHESTHGMLESKQIPYKRHNWLQVERICRNEQNRFLKRLEPIYGSSLKIPFDSNNWLIMRPIKNRIRELVRRIREEKSKAQQSVPGYPPQGVGSPEP